MLQVLFLLHEMALYFEPNFANLFLFSKVVVRGQLAKSIPSFEFYFYFYFFLGYSHFFFCFLSLGFPKIRAGGRGKKSEAKKKKWRKKKSEGASVDRAAWKPCTLNWGVVPLGCDVDVNALHTLMGSILLRRWALNREKFLKSAARLPWDKAADTPSLHVDFNWNRFPSRAPSSWKYGPERYTAFLAWLRSLEFSEDSNSCISNIELGISFEVFSGILLRRCKQTAHALSVRERGKVMSLWLSWLRKHCADSKLDCPLPGGKVKIAYCLRPIGAPPVSGGHTPRAKLCAGSIAIIVKHLTRSIRCLADRDWGTSPLPAYDTTITARAAQWTSPRRHRRGNTASPATPTSLARRGMPRRRITTVPPPVLPEPEPPELPTSVPDEPPTGDPEPDTTAPKRRQSKRKRSPPPEQQKRKKRTKTAPTPTTSASPPSDDGPAGSNLNVINEASATQERSSSCPSAVT